MLAEDIPKHFELFSNPCQESIRKNICGNAFGKCAPNGLNFDVYPNATVDGVDYFVPFQRPCLSVCDDIHQYCTGLPGFLGYMAPDCDERIDYSNGAISGKFNPYKYDHYTDGVCNAMIPAFAAGSPLDGNVEPYMYEDDRGDVCYGVVDSVYIPPLDSLSSLGIVIDNISQYSPQQPRFAVQSLLRDKLDGIFDAIPTWLSRKCYIALTRYMCGTYLKESVRVSLLNGELDPTIWGNKYTLLQWIKNSSTPILNNYNVTYDLTHRPLYMGAGNVESCEEYSNVCGDFLNMVNSSELTAISPYLIPECASLLDPTVMVATLDPNIISEGLKSEYFVSNSFHVAQEYLMFPAHSSSGNTSKLAQSIALYEPTCPSMFIVPATIFPETHMVKGTGCARGCKSPTWTEEEWENKRQLYIHLSATSVACLVALIWTWRHHPTKSKQRLVLNYMKCSLLYVCCLLSHLLLPFSRHFCKDETCGITAEDGLNSCSVIGTVHVIGVISTLGFWCSLCVQTYRTLQGSRKANSVDHWYYEYAVAVCVCIAVLPSTIIDGYQYYDGSYVCAGVHTANISSTLRVIVVIGFILVGICHICATIYVIARRLIIRSKNHYDDILQTWHVIWAPLKFLLFSLLVYLFSFIVVMLNHRYRFSEDMFVAWMQCVFYEDWRGAYTPWSTPRCSHLSPDTFRAPFWSDTLLKCPMYGSGILLFFVYAVDFVMIWRTWLGFDGSAKRQLQVSKSSTLGRIQHGIAQPVHQDGIMKYDDPHSSLFNNINSFLSGQDLANVTAKEVRYVASSGMKIHPEADANAVGEEKGEENA